MILESSASLYIESCPQGRSGGGDEPPNIGEKEMLFFGRVFLRLNNGCGGKAIMLVRLRG